jgi:predicted amidohydrolase
MVSGFNRILRLGIVQTTVDSTAAWSKTLHMSAVEEEWVISQMQQHLSSLAQEVPKPNIVLLPELSIPLGFLPRLRRISAQMNTIIIAGLDFEIVPNVAKKAMNRAAVIVPDAWGRRHRSSRATVRYVGKTYSAWREEQNLKRLGYAFHSVPEVWVFDAGSYGRFAVAICYDLLDLDRVAMYRLKIQHLFILAYNPDIPSFDHAAEALARMIYCNVIVCNTGTHGGSIAVSPYKGIERRLIYRHSGSGLSTSQTISLPVHDLVLAQTNAWPANKPREFKSLPPGSAGANILIGMEASVTGSGTTS